MKLIEITKDRRAFHKLQFALKEDFGAYLYPHPNGGLILTDEEMTPIELRAALKRPRNLSSLYRLAASIVASTRTGCCDAIDRAHRQSDIGDYDYDDRPEAQFQRIFRDPDNHETYWWGVPTERNSLPRQLALEFMALIAADEEAK